MNLGDGHGQPIEGGVSAVLRSDDDDAVDPHLERIRNAAGDESDEEVLRFLRSFQFVWWLSFHCSTN